MTGYVFAEALVYLLIYISLKLSGMIAQMLFNDVKNYTETT